MINRDNAFWTPMSAPALEWLPTGVRASNYGDVYFSLEDGLRESIYTFIEGNNLQTRFATLAHGHFCVAETGFGTGLNFLLACRTFLESASADVRLHYIGVDKHPLRLQQLKQALALWPELAELAHELQQQWPAAVPGVHRLNLFEGRVTLDLWWEDAQDALEDLASYGERWVDAWFLDGFAPSKNDSLWQPELFTAMAQLSKSGATFSTFTAAGDVRRGLEAAGFQVAKRPGFGKKREALKGHIADIPQLQASTTPWDLSAAKTGSATQPVTTPWDLAEHSSQDIRQQKVVIIGAGLAGAHCANALARRGAHVTVLDQADIASGGSSNRQGLTYTRLSRRFGNLSDFTVTSFHYATRLYKRMLETNQLERGSQGDDCGYVQLTDDTQTLNYLREALDPEDLWAEVVSQETLSERLGTQASSGGIFYREALWLYPKAVCESLLDHPNILCRTSTGSLRLCQGNAHYEPSSSKQFDGVSHSATQDTGDNTTASPMDDSRDDPAANPGNHHKVSGVSVLRDPPWIITNGTNFTETADIVLIATAGAAVVENLTQDDAARALEIDATSDSAGNEESLGQALADETEREPLRKSERAALNAATEALSAFPFQWIRGQTSLLPTNAPLRVLPFAVCGQGYVPPAVEGVHCIGASYGPNDTDIEERAAEHAENLDKLNAALPELNIDREQPLKGHVALRCTTADYLPVVGPVVAATAFEHTYQELRSRSKKILPSRAPAIDGLYVCASFGSRGLTAAALSAEIIASDFFNEPPPVPRYLRRAVSSVRFNFRRLIKG